MYLPIQSESPTLPQDFQAALLVNTAFEPLLLVDKNGLVIAANQAARSIFLGEKADSTPKSDTPSDLAPEPKADIIGMNITNLIDSPELETLTYCVFSTDGECPEMQFPIGDRTFQVRGVRGEHMGEHYMALALRDITQLLRLNRARRDMVANISHELRTPISGIRLLSETLNRQRLGKKQRQKIMRKIGRELDTLHRIVEGMHDLAMIESGQAIMRLIETPVHTLIDEALERLDEQIEQQKIRISVDVPDDLYMLVDVDQIGRVLTNLIHNAVRFTSKKGRVKVQAESRPEEDMVLIRISDDGPGIPEAERSRVFERFYQVDTARSIRRGSGLGLAIAKHIIGSHGGEVWIEDSTLGGACLALTLPAAPPPPETVPPESNKDEE